MLKKSVFIIVAAVVFAVPFYSLAYVVNPGGPMLVACYPFSRSLSIGASGSDVLALQNYLEAQGYFNTTPTGYFGVITRAAVGQWQAQNNVAALGSAGNGTFGPLSRGLFGRLCGNGGSGSGNTQATSSFSANPQSGVAPLTVQFIATAPQGSTLGRSIDFGDGTQGTLGVVPVCSNCNAEAVVSHTYAATGTYTVTLTGGACSCPANGVCNCPNLPILGTATVVVDSTSTTGISGIQQLDAPGNVTLSQGGIAEIRNESAYFTLQNITASSAMIQITPVGCWNSFPSDPAPKIVCMIAVIPTPPQTLTIGETYTSGNYSITLTQLTSSTATLAVQ
jgi:peptidoglycan hydrolase-like protein with peptidoglycan-binding domain